MQKNCWTVSCDTWPWFKMGWGAKVKPYNKQLSYCSHVPLLLKILCVPRIFSLLLISTHFFIIFRCVCVCFFLHFSASWIYIKILLIEDFFFFGWRTWHFQGVRVLPGLLYKVVAINVKGGRKESVYHLFGGFIISSFFLLLFWWYFEYWNLSPSDFFFLVNLFKSWARTMQDIVEQMWK